jgi:hypothetical protein
MRHFYFKDTCQKNFIWEQEEKLKEDLILKRYKPAFLFGGYTECYGVENFKQIYEKLKRIEEDRITEKV